MAVDVFISGAGYSGLLAAYAFAETGLSVQCVDPKRIPDGKSCSIKDHRSTAHLAPTVHFFEELGIWKYLVDDAEPLAALRVIDTYNRNGNIEVRTDKSFLAHDINNQQFGFNVALNTSKKVLGQLVQEHPKIDLQLGKKVCDIKQNFQSVDVILSNGEQIEARLLVGADGRDSFVREKVGLPVKRFSLSQDALAFTVEHARSHESVSAEIYFDGGPFTFVPLPKLGNINQSAIVWMERSENAALLKAMSEFEFNQAITKRSLEIFGPLKRTSNLNSWPAKVQLAKRLVASRVALIGEAAHVIPPIGAQGFNMSVQDIKVLTDLANGNPSALGSYRMLSAYERARLRDMKLRVSAIAVLNEVSKSSNPFVKGMRSIGLDVLHSLTPFRKRIMQFGLGNPII